MHEKVRNIKSTIFNLHAKIGGFFFFEGGGRGIYLCAVNVDRIAYAVPTLGL